VPRGVGERREPQREGVRPGGALTALPSPCYGLRFTLMLPRAARRSHVRVKRRDSVPKGERARGTALSRDSPVR